MLSRVIVANPNEPMRKEKKDDDYSLHNPYSSVTCFILYLYSMEFGDPPLYAELNRVARNMDKEYVDMLGPFSRALNEVTWQAEDNRRDDDKIENGQIKKRTAGVPFNLSGMFLLFRGA